jgi:tRNA (cytidine/uridine-2'-O-)-methyltransferase
MKVVLIHPEIPQNTGNIGRSCVATNTFMYLVKPLGFKIDSKEIRRSGMDYWEKLNYKVVDDLTTIREENPDSRLWFVSTKGEKSYTDIEFRSSDILVFGNEGSGLPKEYYDEFHENLIQIPMSGEVRSLNLATAAGIVLYEAYRQIGMSK